MKSGSDNSEKNHVSFLVGGFGCGKSRFYETVKAQEFPDAVLLGFDETAGPIVQAFNLPQAERTPEQTQLLYDVTHLKSYISNQGIVNKAVNELADDAEERLATLDAKRPTVTRTDLRSILRHEIAAYDGCRVVESVKAGKRIVLDSSGRPDIRLGIYELLKQNSLLESCEFSSYNMEAPTEEELGRTAAKRLMTPKKGGNFYDSHGIEENYTSLFPAPIYVPENHDLNVDEKTLVEACQSMETMLFDEGRHLAYFVTRSNSGLINEIDYDIIRILPSEKQATEEQHNRVTNTTPPTLLKPSMVKLAEHAMRLGEGKF